MFRILRSVNSCIHCFNQSYRSALKCKYIYFSTQQNVNDDVNKPVKYSSTAAFKHKAKLSREGTDTNRLWYEPLVIFSSLLVFTVYFFILREENDIDKELNRSLYSRIEGLEEQQLRISLEYNEEQGLETIDIRNRLKEIEREKQKAI